MTTELARKAVEAILSMMEWTREISDQFLDGDPETRRQLLEDRNVARDVIRELNAVIAAPSDLPEGGR